jgi:hypothetical protein
VSGGGKIERERVTYTIRVTVLLIFVFCASLLFLPNSASATTTPTAAWNVTNDGTGHVTELTGTYSAGTIVGAPTATTGPNSSGAALSFVTGQAVNLGQNFNFGSSDFTIAIWLKTTTAATYVAVGEYNGSGNNLWCGIGAGPAATCSALGSASTRTMNASGYNDGNWHLFGIIRRGTSLYISVDGVDSSPATIGAGETFAPGGNLYINQFGSSGLFNGSFTIYEAGVWMGTGLLSTEMAAKYADPGTLWANPVFTAGTISLASKTSTTVNLSSTAATGGTSPYTYQWYRSTSTGFTPGAGNILSGQTSLTLNDTGLTAFTPYYYKIRATDNVSATVDSTEFTTTTDAIATSYTFTGPTSGGINSVSTNFTITPNGEYTGTITPSSTGSGTFSPTSLTWAASSAAQTFTYTPTSTSGSPHTISVSSSPAITNSSGTISYTVNNFFYSNNFDSETVGTLPTGWANLGSATWQVGTVDAISGSNTLYDPIFHVLGVAVYTGTSATADTAGQISQIVHLDGSSRGANTGLFLRVSSDGNNGYLFLPIFDTGKLVVFKRVNGAYGALNTQLGTASGSTFSNGDHALVKAEISGTTLRWKMWKSTASEPGSWAESLTDSSISVAGYIGIHENYNNSNQDSTLSSLDDIYWGVVGTNFSNTPATSFTFTGPTSGTVDSISTNFTVSPNGIYTGTITPASTGSGTFSPTSLSWDSSSSPQTFTYTPTSTSGSPHTISVSSSPTITNSSGTISYTVSIGTNTIAVNNAAWAAGRSPYNWYTSGSTYTQSINPGAYFKIKFSGTSVSLGVDVSAMSGVAAKKYPRITYQIDGGSWQTYQLLSTDTQVSLGSGLADITHDLEVIFLSSDAYTTKWDGTMSLKITGLILDTGKTLSASTMLSKHMLVFGDSITEGSWVLGVHDDLTNYSDYEQSNSSYATGVASDLNAEYGNSAFGGLAWESGFTGTPAFISSWNYILGTNSRLTGGLLSPAPDYILVNMGTNGGVSSGTVVSNWLTAARAAAGLACKIFILIPFNQTGSANITTGFNSYISGSTDTNTFLINLGSSGTTYADSIPTYSYDGLHPNVAGHAQLRTLITSAILSDIQTAPTLSVTNSPVTYNAFPQVATVSGSVAGTVSNVKYAGSATVPTNAGTYAITADFTPTDSVDYSSLTGASAGNFIINAATQSTLTFTGQTVTYPTTFSALSTTGGSGTGSVTYAVTTAGTAGCSIVGTALSYTSVGTCGVTATKAANSNYNSVSSAEATFTINALSSAKDITAFSFAGLTPAVTATINGNAIAATVPYGTAVNALVATFTTTGSLVAVGVTTQTSGITPNDFTSPVIYTVTAADSTTQTYTVTVAITPIGTHTITASAGANGSITPSGSVSVNNGADQAFTITANSGYHIDTVTADSVAVSATSPYTFTVVTADHTISATFAADPVVNHGGGGFSAPYPTAPAGGFTATRDITNSQNKTVLHFGFGNDITNIAISDNISFAPATYINATSSVEWTATTTKILYIKYCNRYGRCSNPISLQINAFVPAPLPITIIEEHAVPRETPTVVKDNSKKSPSKSPNNSSDTKKEPSKTQAKELLTPSTSRVELLTPSTSRVEVVIVDTNKEPVEGATVTLHSTPRTTITDKDGRAVFEGVEPGPHRLVVNYQGQEGEQAINLDESVAEFQFKIQIEARSPLVAKDTLVVLGILALVIASLTFLLFKKYKS